MTVIFSEHDVENKILQTLFYDAQGKKFLKGFQENFSLYELKKKYQKLTNKKDVNFWKEVIALLKSRYCVITVNESELVKLCSSDFNKFVQKLMQLHFDEVFSADDRKSISSFEEFKKTLRALLNKDCLTLEDGEIMRIYFPRQREEAGNVAPLTPGSQSYYPNLLIKIDGKNKLISLSGGARQKSNFVESINSKSENVLITEEVAQFKEFQANMPAILTLLNTEDIFVKRIQFKNSMIRLDINGSSVLDFENVIGRLRLFQTAKDIVSLKRLDCETVIKVEKTPINVSFRIYVGLHRIKEKHYFKIRLVLSNDKKAENQNIIREEIEKKLERIRLTAGSCFDFPVSVYFDKLLHKPTKLDADLIDKLFSEDSVVKLLKSKSILNNPGAIFDVESFIKLFVKILNSAKGTDGSKEGLEIVEAKSEEGLIILRVKLFSNKKGGVYSKLMSLLIPINKSPKKYDGIVNVVLDFIDIHYLCGKLAAKEYVGARKYLHENVNNYLIHQYDSIFESEVSKSIIIIESYLSDLKSDDEARAGKNIERAVNILLKYAFRNFIPFGGANSPDCYVVLKKNWLGDSKQHKKLSKTEFTKMAGYLTSFCQKENLPAAEGGFFVISRMKIAKAKEGSLNLTSRDDVIDKKNYLGFLTLEFLVDFTKLIKINRNEILANQTLSNKILEETENILEKSSKLAVLSKLTKIEDETLNRIKSQIGQSSHIPGKKEQL